MHCYCTVCLHVILLYSVCMSGMTCGGPESPRISAPSDPHVPASLLKLWYRELLEPLIPSHFYEQVSPMSYVSICKEIFAFFFKCVLRIIYPVLHTVVLRTVVLHTVVLLAMRFGKYILTLNNIAGLNCSAPQWWNHQPSHWPPGVTHATMVLRNIFIISVEENFSHRLRTGCSS